MQEFLRKLFKIHIFVCQHFELIKQECNIIYQSVKAVVSAGIFEFQNN